MSSCARQIDGLRRAAVASDTAAAARDRRQQRLQAAPAAMPALHTAAVAETVGWPPAAVHKALVRFVARVVLDLGELHK